MRLLVIHGRTFLSQNSNSSVHTPRDDPRQKRPMSICFSFFLLYNLLRLLCIQLRQLYNLLQLTGTFRQLLDTFWHLIGSHRKLLGPFFPFDQIRTFLIQLIGIPVRKLIGIHREVQGPLLPFDQVLIQVYCVDLRCHGRSPFRQECTIELMTEDIKRFIRDRRLERVAFVCHSLSSMVAYMVTIDQPGVVEKLVMVDLPPYPTYTKEIHMRDLQPELDAQNRYLEVLDPALSLPEAKKKILAISKASTVSAGQRIFMQKVAYELTKVNNKFTWKTDINFLFDGYSENFTPPPRGRSDHEMLLIRCQDSTRISDKKFEAVLRYNPNAKLVTFKDTTHLLMFEKPAEFLKVLKNFLY